MNRLADPLPAPRRGDHSRDQRRSPPARESIAIFIAFSGQGGVERMVTQLAAGLAAAGHPVDLVLAKAEGAHLAGIPDAVRVINLGTRHTAQAIRPLRQYLTSAQPAVLLAAKERAMLAAARAVAGLDSKAGVAPRLVGRLGTTLSAALAHKSALLRWWRYRRLRREYPRFDRIVTVSEGVARDVHGLTGLPLARLPVVRNPVITPRLQAQAEAAPEHPWLAHKECPVLVAAGRLTPQKDFATLLTAFSRLQQTRRSRLIILGDGDQRRFLEQLADRLGVGAQVSLPGFLSNPYPSFRAADLFVLSSRWEGSPNVLTEALALGTPVVATDCPSGPREILQDGRYGPLVPVGDAPALAAAMAATLEAPLPAATLREAAAEYTVERAVAGYRRAFGLE